jgi:hypothetical protein
MRDPEITTNDNGDVQQMGHTTWTKGEKSTNAF